MGLEQLSTERVNIQDTFYCAFVHCPIFFEQKAIWLSKKIKLYYVYVHVKTNFISLYTCLLIYKFPMLFFVQGIFGVLGPDGEYGSASRGLGRT